MKTLSEIICVSYGDEKLARFQIEPHIFPMLPDEQPSPEQIKIWRRMSFEQRVEIARSIFRSVWEMKAAGIRWLNPSWSEQQVSAQVAKMFSAVNPETCFESIMPMLSAYGERIETQMLAEWLKTWIQTF